MMIDLQKSKLEAEALAKLRKEQFYRETLAQELAVMIDEHFKSKEPLREVIPQFVVALKDLVNTSCEIFYYLEGVEAAEPKAPCDKCENTDEAAKYVKASQAIDAELIDEWNTAEAAMYVKASQAITAELNKDNKKTLAEMVEAQAAEEAPSTAAESEEPKAAEPKKRIPSKDIISDEELDRHYFKEGLSIPVIASMFKVGASGLYKRIEQMKADRKKIEKECAR